MFGIWSRGTAKGFDFGRGGGGGNKTEYLLAAGLGVVIIGALGLTLWGMFGGSRGGGSAPKEVHYVCEKCGYEFTVPIKELIKENPSSMDEISAARRDCPKCGAKNTAWQAIECPNCHKYFVSQVNRMRIEAMMHGRSAPPGYRDVCPFCKTDLQQWYQTHQEP